MYIRPKYLAGTTAKKLAPVFGRPLHPTANVSYSHLHSAQETSANQSPADLVTPTHVGQSGKCHEQDVRLE